MKTFVLTYLLLHIVVLINAQQVIMVNNDSIHHSLNPPKTYTVLTNRYSLERMLHVKDSIYKHHQLLVESQKKKVQLITNYVQYLQKTALNDTVIMWFIKNDNYVKFYPCYLAPFAEYTQKLTKQAYCVGVISDLQELMEKYNIHSSVTDSGTKAFTYHNISPLSYLNYQYCYDYKKEFYKKEPNGRCIKYNHKCLIVDVLKHDPANQIMFILTFNYPGKYYSLLMFDYGKQIAIWDIQLLYHLDLEKLYTHSGKTYFVYWAKHLLAYTNDYQIEKKINIYDIFTLYEKMKIKTIYHIATNKHLAEKNNK